MTHISALQIDVGWNGLAATVTVTGELDITSATALSRRLLGVGAAHPENVVLDLSGLVFIDVAGARALDETRHLLETECPVILLRPRPSARQVFRLTGLLAEEDGQALGQSRRSAQPPVESSRLQ